MYRLKLLLKTEKIIFRVSADVASFTDT